MKRLILAVVFLAAAGSSMAADYGIAYNNGAPAFRVRWDDRFISEISLSGWVNNYYDVSSFASADTTIAPVIYTVAGNEWGRLSAALKFRFRAEYDYDPPMYSGYTRVHSYGLALTFPELEINIPYVEGLCVLASFSMNIGWGYNDYGKFSGLTWNLSGPTLGSIGVVYYFNAGRQEKKAEAAPQPVPAEQGK